MKVVETRGDIVVTGSGGIGGMEQTWPRTAISGEHRHLKPGDSLWLAKDGSVHVERQEA